MSSAKAFISQVEGTVSHQLVDKDPVKDPTKNPICEWNVLDDSIAQGRALGTRKISQEMSEAVRESEKAMKKDQSVVSAILERLGVELGGDPMGPVPPELLKEISDASQKAIASRRSWGDKLAALGESHTIDEALNAIGPGSAKARSSRI